MKAPHLRWVRSIVSVALSTLSIGIAIAGAPDPVPGQAPPAAVAAKAVDFQRDVRPILADNCFLVSRARRSRHARPTFVSTFMKTR